MSDLKTKPTDVSVAAFLDGISDERRRADCRAVATIMERATGEKPKMWGPSMVGFGQYHYRYESGREGDWFLTGFSPRKNDLTLYLLSGFDGFDELMKRLGKHKTGKSCLYVKRLSDLDLAVLEQLIVESVAQVRARYGAGA
jgi:hypothetical protein